MKTGKYLFFVKISRYEHQNRYEEIEVIEDIPGYIKCKHLSGHIEWYDKGTFDRLYDLCTELNQSKTAEL